MVRRSFAALIITCAVVLSASAQGPVVLPKGEGPRFFIVMAVTKDGLDIQRVNPPTKSPVSPPPIRHTTTFTKVDPKQARSDQVRATDAKGKALTAEEVVKRVKPGAIVLVSEDEDPIDPVYLAVLKDDTVVLTWVEPRRFGTAGQQGK